MLTDAPPRDRHRAGFDQSDRNKTIDLWMRTAVHIAAGRAGSQSRMHSVYDVAYLNSCVLTYGQITEGCLKR